MNFETEHRHFPNGFSHPGMTMWSGFILPFIEQNNLYGTLDLNGPWRKIGEDTPNSRSLGVLIQVYRCPSADISEKQLDPLIGVDRVPCCFLACAGGLNNRESGELPWCGMDQYVDPVTGTVYAESDGVFFLNSRTTSAKITDGLSNTVLVGETIPDQYLFGTDYAGNQQKVDHWCIGSGELEDYPKLIPFGSADLSECLGSTACPINSIKVEESPMNDKELSYGSAHRQGANMGFADGHIRFVTETVDREVWSAVGSRSNSEIEFLD
jgi:prepilin-type processing-associated H-X9-DG protein